MKIWWILGLVLTLAACQSNRTTDENALQEVSVEGDKVSDIIRNPVTANEPVDTVNVAKMSFEEVQYDFGRIHQGDVVEHTFKFTNTGKVPLVISDARSTCGCTVPEYPKEPIAPGESGEIFVRFNSKNKFDRQSKPVTITANTYPSETKVYIHGYIIKKEETNP